MRPQPSEAESRRLISRKPGTVITQPATKQRVGADKAQSVLPNRPPPLTSWIGSCRPKFLDKPDRPQPRKQEDEQNAKTGQAKPFFPGDQSGCDAEGSHREQ